MGGIKNIFKKSVSTFDDVKTMVTRKLPLPDLDEKNDIVQFTARMSSDGYWTLDGRHNMETMTDGIEKINRALNLAIARHSGRPLSDIKKSMKMTFDTVFLVMREMEEALLAYNNTAPGPEPDKHYLAAHRLMAPRFRSMLDDRFFSATHGKQPILPPRAAKAAERPVEKPKPN